MIMIVLLLFFVAVVVFVVVFVLIDKILKVSQFSQWEPQVI